MELYIPLLATFVGGSESPRVRKFQGAKVPHLELSLPGANGLGSEKSIIRYFPSTGRINIHDRRYFLSAIRTLTLLTLTLITTITHEPEDGK